MKLPRTRRSRGRRLAGLLAVGTAAALLAAGCGSDSKDDSSKNAKASLALLQALKPGKVQKITPDKGETLRGVKLSLSRVASLNKMKVEVYDDGTHVYVKLA